MIPLTGSRDRSRRRPPCPGVGRPSGVLRPLRRSSGPATRRRRATLAGRPGRAPRPADGASASGAGDQALAVEQARDDTGGGDVHREEGEREPDRERDRGRDDLEGDEGGEAEHGQSGEGGELLGDPDVARSRRDGDAEPDRPEGEERDEEELGEELGGWKTTARTTRAAPTRIATRTTA